MLKKTLPDIDIETISFTFEDSIDESPVAAKIAERFETNHHVVHIENYLKDLPKAISIVKQPWDLHWYHVVKKAKSLSNYLLSGDGGDELFGGYTFRYEKFLSLVNPNFSPIEKVKAYLECHERDWVPDQEKVFSKKAQFSWDEIFTLLEPYFDNPLPVLAQVFLADFNGKLLYNWIPLNTGFSKYFEVKPVAPMLSQELISYATHISYDLKYDHQRNIGKILLRKLLGKYEIDMLVSNTKQGFSVNTMNLWKTHGRELCNHYLSDARIIKGGLVNPQWVKKHMKRQDDDLGVRYVNKFLGLLAMEIWFRLFITKEMRSTDTLI